MYKIRLKSEGEQTETDQNKLPRMACYCKVSYMFLTTYMHQLVSPLAAIEKTSKSFGMLK